MLTPIIMAITSVPEGYMYKKLFLTLFFFTDFTFKDTPGGE